MVDTTGFRILLLIHVLAAVVAFGGNFVQPMLVRGGADNATLGKANKVIQLPSLIILLLAGIGLILTSDEVFKFSQTWVSIAFLVVIVAIVLQFLVARAYENDNRSIVPGLTGGLHICLVIALYLMIWKPGWPS
ncbi:hypothetical protein [Dermatobacter hominis]|uniref:hypothetical protein n=1 Tax=Dermatobacter hominis TaxID=2884263 RepID=UPI001D11D14F|nr:hypothetical protein [Dermatobacter hominis]UDY37293.1 hypothetical protein LH044_07075 [Dermatobacter hominis]